MTLTNVAQIDSDNGELSEAIPVELLALVAEVDDLTAMARAEATMKAYAADWRCFTGWCGRQGLAPLPAQPATVALYIADLAARRKASTIRRRLTTISQAHAEAGHESPTRAALVSNTWKGIRRKYGVAQTRKAPIRTGVLRSMVESLNLGTLIGARDRALLVVDFAGAFRRSEVVGFDVLDVAKVPAGLTLELRWSKTDQEGEGVKLGLPYGSDELTCPVRSYEAWMDASGIIEGAVFRPVTKGGALGLQRLSDRAVAEVVKRTAGRIGLDPTAYSAHSVRAGFITAAAEAGVPERDIMRQTRQKSLAVMRRYIRDAHIFRDNAAAKVGL